MSSSSTGAMTTWTLFGLLAPLVAFSVDAGMHVDPILWGSGGFPDGLGGAREGIHARQIAVYALLGASMLGLVLLMTVRTRAARAVALPLLGLGVLLAGLHAVVFLPLLPMSLIGILMIVGLLGLTPYTALAVFVHALSVAIREQRDACDGRPGRWIAAPLACTALPILLTVGPYVYARGAVDLMRGGDPATISRGFRSLGALAPIVRPELTAVYLELDGPAQARMRNLFLERFDEEIDAGLVDRFVERR